MTHKVTLSSLLVAVACSRGAPEQEAAPTVPSTRAPSTATSSALARANREAAHSGNPPAPSTASSGSSTGTGSRSAPPGLGATCEKLCAYSGQLKCGKEQDCVEGCIEMGSIDPCTPAFRDLYSCLLREPLTHWECGADRMGAIRDGYCEKEQEAAAGCVEKLTQR